MLWNQFTRKETDEEISRLIQKSLIELPDINSLDDTYYLASFFMFIKLTQDIDRYTQ